MLEVKTTNLAPVRKRFKEMQNRAKTPRHAMDVIGGKAFKAVIQNFSKEENKDGVKWEKWKDPKTKARISRRPTKRGGTKLLQDTGRLRGSIRWAASNIEARVFTKVKYAKYHNYGDGSMKRQFMYVDDKTRLKYLKTLLEYIEGA